MTYRFCRRSSPSHPGGQMSGLISRSEDAAVVEPAGRPVRARRGFEVDPVDPEVSALGTEGGLVCHAQHGRVSPGRPAGRPPDLRYRRCPGRS